MHKYIAQHSLTTTQIDDLLKLVHDPSFVGHEVGFSSAGGYKARVTSTAPAALRQVSLYDNEFDGTNDMCMWYRPVEDIVDYLISNTEYACNMDWEFRRTVDATSGHRVFTCMADSLWLEGVTAQVRSTMGPHMYVVPVVVGSDATQTRKRGGAHPVYITIGTLRADVRRRNAAWKLAAFIPALKEDKMASAATGNAVAPWRVKRRRRQVHNAAVHAVLEGLKTHYTGRGVTRRCGDGVQRQVVYVFAQYVTDRQEHETVLFAVAHSCFHCECARDARWQLSACTWPVAHPKHGQTMRQAADSASASGASSNLCIHWACMLHVSTCNFC